MDCSVFDRDCWCLLGLPVDNLTMQTTKEVIRKIIKQRGTAVLATINVNWVVTSCNDVEFRDAIINSDIVTLDGRPLLWLSRLIKYPMHEVVAGSSLIQELLEEKREDQMTIFLFGGEDGVAQKAMENINHRDGGLKAVGALNPGFVSVEEMSDDHIISKINETQPDILLVALGAKKGTQWIEKNKHKLNARIISHLGATINFLAGTIERAPLLFRRMGLEWLWRIGQEPKLILRYAADGAQLFVRLLVLFPAWLHYRRNTQQTFEGSVIDMNKDVVLSGNTITIRLGAQPDIDDVHLQNVLRESMIQIREVVLDCQATAHLDAQFMGRMLILGNRIRKNGGSIKYVNVSEQLALYFRLFSVSV